MTRFHFEVKDRGGWCRLDGWTEDPVAAERYRRALEVARRQAVRLVEDGDGPLRRPELVLAAQDGRSGE